MQAPSPGDPDMLRSANNWFDIPAKDFDRALKFCAALHARGLPFRDTGSTRPELLPCEHDNGVGDGAPIEGTHVYPQSMN